MYIFCRQICVLAKKVIKIEMVYLDDIFSKEPILMKLILKPIKHVTLGNNYKRRKILNWKSSAKFTNKI